MRRWPLVACAALLCGCAARAPARPSGTATPDPSAVEAFNEATRRCAGLQDATAELRLSGRAGRERVRGTLHVGLAAPASLRVEAVAPFGQPFFILAGRDDRATLLLPRDDNRVLRDAPVRDVLERLTGLALTATDLRLLLTACLRVPAEATNGRAFDDDWRAVDLDSGIVAYLRRVGEAPAVVAADHGDWRVDYADYRHGWPRQVRLRSAAGDVDIRAALDQVEINAGIDPRAFEVVVPPDAETITIDQLRSVTPLREPPDA